MQECCLLDWTSPTVRQTILEWQQMLLTPGRDSRVVRTAVAYSTRKKRFMEACKQQFYRLTKRQTHRETLRIFFWLPGGLGDAACARRLVRAYRQLLPAAHFEIFCPILQAANTVFSDMENVSFATDTKRYWPDYDLVVQACLAAKFLYINPERLSRLAPDFLSVLTQAQAAQKTLGVLLEDIFLTEPILGRLMYRLGAGRFDLLSYTAGVSLVHPSKAYLPVHKQVKEKFGLAGKDYLTFHDGCLGEASLPTRMWPRENWQALLQQIKQAFPHIVLVQLGEAKSHIYPQADVCLVGKTQLTDLPTLLSGARLHIDTESGLVHLAQYTPVKSVVLFGPSQLDFLAYARNVNLSAAVCDACFWLTPNWMQICPLGHQPAACMQALSVEKVWEAVRENLIV